MMASSVAAIPVRREQSKEFGVIQAAEALSTPTRRVIVSNEVDFFEDFVAAVMSRPEVLDCYATTGDEDYMLRVLAPSVRAYDRFLQDFLLDLPYVDHVRSHFVLRRIKAETRIPPEIFPQAGQR